MKLYGYDKSGEALEELKEVTICVTPSQAKLLGKFIQECVAEMDSNEQWEHKHFPNNDETSLVLFNAERLPEAAK